MKKTTRIIFILIFILLLLSVVSIYNYSSGNNKISDFKISDQSKKIKEASKYGDEVVGWLRVEGTNIDMALIRANENTDLLKGDYDFAWTYSYPDDKGNRPAYISHNIRNVSSNPIIGDKTMKRFEQLMSFIYLDFVEKKQFIEFTNSSGKTDIYRIFGVSLVKDDQNSAYLDTYTDDEQKRYIKKVRRESMFDIETSVESDDLMLTLFTCTRFYGPSTNYSFRIDARKIRDDEKLIYAKVRENDNYNKIKKQMKEGETNEKS